MRAPSRALLVLGGAAAALLVLEVGLRLRPPVELPLNDPYQFTRLVGRRQFRVPFHTYREVYPLAFDDDGYYARSDGAIDYHFDQHGGRWREAAARDLGERVAIVVGDSFTLGFGLRYEDTYVFKVEQALRGPGRARHFVNFAEPGADARASLRNYRAVRDAVPHDLLLYGLHLNDLIHFPTSYVATAAADPSWARHRVRLIAFVARTIEKRRERAERIRQLTDPAQWQQPLFRENMAAIETMQRECARHSRGFVVVLLPILVDLGADTFESVYAAIRAALTERGIAFVDLTRSLDGAPDSAFWILPFDQHPNAAANEAFARRLAAALGEP